MSFSAQLLLIAVLWRLAKDELVENVPADAVSSGTPRTVKFDPEKDSDWRAWCQLVRPYNGSLISSAISSMAGMEASSLLMNETIAIPAQAPTQPVYASQIVANENDSMLLSIQDQYNDQA